MISILVQIAEQLIVGFQAFAETDAWVEDDLLVAKGFKNLALSLEEFHDGLMDVTTEGLSLIHI